MSQLSRRIPQTSQHGATTWKVTLKSVLNDIANWHMRQSTNFSGPSPRKTGRSGNCGRVFRECTELLVCGKRPDLLWTVNYLEPSVRSATPTAHHLNSSHIQQQSDLSCLESSNRLQTRIVPERPFCRTSDGPQGNIRWCSVHIFDRIRLCRFHGLVKSKLLCLSAAQKLNLYRLMQCCAWRAFQH